MSSYLSSFLIEPVVRQARRFSRSNSQDPSDAFRPSLTVGEPLQNGYGQDASVAVPLAPRLHPQEHDFIDTVTPHGRAGSPTSANGSNATAVVWSGEDIHSASRFLVVDDMVDHEASARQDSVHIGLDRSVISTNMNHNRLHSTTSSLNNSAQSLLDADISPANAPSQVSEITVRNRAGSQNSRPGEGPLPADDGMSHMRKQIIAIQRTDSPNEVKARLVHDLMTEKHNSLQHSLRANHRLRPRSPESSQSSDHPITPSSPGSMDSFKRTLSPSSFPLSTTGATNPFQLSSEDLEPTFYEKPGPVGKEAANGRRLSESEEEPKALGCAHYKRNIKLQCSACHRWYTCRFCHDAVEDHMLNRRQTKNMLCMLCGRAQPASEECALCNERAAWYYCDVCKLWDDDPQKNIYHCEDCGICRIGQGLGKDFFHCKTCCVCMSVSIRDSHRCIERSTDSDCPICGEYMFTSPQTVVFMRCGHSIHSRCYYEHMRTSYRCPICSRSIVNMEMQFNRLSHAIESQPMPPEFQDTKAWVFCNDCSAKTFVRYHWLGLKCAVCDSYNTAQLQILSSPTADGDRLLTPDSSPQAEDTSQPMVDVSRTTSRGRSRLTHGDPLRSGISAPPVANTHTSPNLQRSSRSMEPETPSAFPFSHSPSESDLDDSIDTDDEDCSEVEFWG